MNCHFAPCLIRATRYFPDVLDKLTQQLVASQSLAADQVREAVNLLVDETEPTPSKADFLAALARKGETPEEITAFAGELRARAVQPPIEPAWRDSHVILDVVGTGGDRAGTFNISSTVALLCAAAGVVVAKHGNRAVTSPTGSADMLEALGIPINLLPEAAARSLRDHGFAFFFAPNYHPAFKNIAAARKLCAERGQRTIFNFLGPLLNPASPSAQLMGVPQPGLCEPLARVLQSLGVKRGMVVCGKVSGAQGEVTTEAALDELSTLGDNTVAEFYQERGFASSMLSPRDFPLQAATLADLRGGDRAANAETVRRILRGEERGPKRDTVLLNAGAALFVAGAARSIADGWQLAAAVIDDGRAARKLEALTRPVTG